MVLYTSEGPTANVIATVNISNSAIGPITIGTSGANVWTGTLIVTGSSGALLTVDDPSNYNGATIVSAGPAVRFHTANSPLTVTSTAPASFTFLTASNGAVNVGNGNSVQATGSNTTVTGILTIKSMDFD